MDSVLGQPPPPDDLWDLFDPEAADPAFGRSTLARFVRRGVDVDDAVLGQYALAHDLKLNGTHFGRRFPSRYFDATFNFCLTRAGELVASLGFEYEAPGITIWQVQGRRGAGEALSPFAWSRALVDHTVDWANRHGLTEVAMASVEHVHWSTNQGHLDPGRGRLLYDVTARRAGFRRRADGYWCLPLPSAHHP